MRYFKGVSSFGLTVAMPSLRLTGPVIRTRCVMYGAIFALLFATYVPLISQVRPSAVSIPTGIAVYFTHAHAHSFSWPWFMPVSFLSCA